MQRDFFHLFQQAVSQILSWHFITLKRNCTLYGNINKSLRKQVITNYVSCLPFVIGNPFYVLSNIQNQLKRRRKMAKLEEKRHLLPGKSFRTCSSKPKRENIKAENVFLLIERVRVRGREGKQYSFRRNLVRNG